MSRLALPASVPDLTTPPGTAARPWPGRRLALLFVAAAALAFVQSQDILRQYIAVQATWPPPAIEGAEWAHPDGFAFSVAALRLLLLGLGAALPALAVLVRIGRPVGVPGSIVLTSLLVGLLVMGALVTPVGQLVRGSVAMVGPDGQPSSPSTWLVTPLVEELLKLLSIALVIAWTRVHIGPRSGLVIGATVGLGVTVGETVVYGLQVLVEQDGADVLPIVATRFALFGAGLHATTAALTGAALGTWLARGRMVAGVPAMMAALAVAIVTHGAWNRAVEDVAGDLFARFGQAAVLAPAAFLVASIAAVPFLVATWTVLAIGWRRAPRASPTAHVADPA